MSILLVTLFGISCSLPVAVTPNEKVSEPVVGKEVSREFVKSFEPDYRQGSRLVFISTISDNSVPAEEQTVEVLEVKEKTVKLKMTVGSKVNIAEFPKDDSADLPEKGIIFGGEEKIKVPAGEFPKSQKVEYQSAEGKVNLWLVKGIGNVKRTMILPTQKILSVELKEYKIN